MKDIQQQKSYKILLIGDSCTDEYVYGIVERLSPEGPIPVLRQRSVEFKPGMAANVKINLETLGCSVDFITNTESITKTRYIDQKSGYHLLRLDKDTLLQPWSDYEKFNFEKYDSVVISDYGKGFIDYHHIEFIREKFNGPIFLDTKKTNLSRFCGIFIKINEVEYNRCTSINDQLIVTLGHKGALYKTSDREISFAAPKVEVFDVCGAGDTFLSAVAYKYLENCDLDLAIRFAIKASAITVKNNGNYAPTLEEIK